MATELEELQEKFILSKREAHGWWTRAFVAEERLLWALKELGRLRTVLERVALDLTGPLGDEVRAICEEVDFGPSNIPEQRTDGGSSPDEGEALPPGA